MIPSFITMDQARKVRTSHARTHARKALKSLKYSYILRLILNSVWGL